MNANSTGIDVQARARTRVDWGISYSSCEDSLGKEVLMSEDMDDIDAKPIGNEDSWKCTYLDKKILWYQGGITKNL